MNTNLDTADSSPGDGNCRDAGGQCSLRAAIQETNASTDPLTKTIVLRTENHVLTAGALHLEKSVTIEGAGASVTSINGNAASLLITTASSAQTVRISGVTLENANSDTAAITIAPGVSMVVSRSVIRNNRSRTFGGGFRVAGNLELVESAVENNSLPLGVAGGVTSSGGGIFIFTGGSAKIDRSNITDNVAMRGAGIRNAGGRLEIINSTINRNKADARGGGIMNYGAATVTNSTVAFNEANAARGSYIGSEPNFGGGIYNDGDDQAAGTIRLANTIVARNIDHRDARFQTDASPDCYTAGSAYIASGRGNLIGALTPNCDFRFPVPIGQPTDQAGTAQAPIDPLFGYWTFYGYSSAIPLRAGSPAIDRATGGGVDACPATDQRGVARPVGAACDIGAYEGTEGG